MEPAGTRFIPNALPDALRSAGLSCPEVLAEYPLAPMQSAMLLEGVLSNSPGLNVQQVVVELEAGIDLDRLRTCWDESFRHHAVLRSSLSWRGRVEPTQQVHALVEVPWRVENGPGTPEMDATAWVTAFLERDRAAGLPVDAPPLMRLTVLRDTMERARLVWTFHHALLDGRSTYLILREVFARYDGLKEVGPVAEPDAFRAMVTWYAGRDSTKDAAFWRAALADRFEAPVLPLPIPEGGRRDGQVGEWHHRLPPPLAAELGRYASRIGVTASTLIHGAWALLLARYTGQPRVGFAVVTAGRYGSIPGAEEVPGCFIRTLPFRVEVPDDAGLEEWLRSLRARWLAVREHEHASPAQLAAWSHGGDPLAFETLVVCENYELNGRLRQDSPAWAAREVAMHEEPGFPLALSAALTPDGYHFKFTYAPDRYDAGTVSRLARHLTNLLAGLVRSPGGRLGTVALIDEGERQELLELGGGSRRAFPVDESLVQLFERQAARTPKAVAVTDPGYGRSLTYAELNGRANQLAHQLRQSGVGPEDLVGLWLEPSALMIVGLLGILKAGGAYLPIDRGCPVDRAAFMLEESGARALVSCRDFGGRLTSGPPQVWLEEMGFTHAKPAGGHDIGHGVSSHPGSLTEPLTRSEWCDGSTPNPGAAVGPDQLAYVIYTSGTTGRPKGSLLTHRNVVRLFAATHDWFGFGPGDVWTMFHSVAFDFSVWEIWGALLYGERLVIVPYAVARAPDQFCELLERERVTVLNQTPSAFGYFQQAEATRPARLALRYVIFGGEALNLETLRPWFDRHGEERPRLINMYGITETTVHVTYRPLGRADLGTRSVVGVPIPDLEIRLLDARGELVPVGVPGEIHVGGAGLARGYLHRPELTAERFIPDPFSSAPGSRLYRSGDLARWLPGGDLEYLGRLDHQVKIRGYRVELGEIETVLAALPGIAQAVVLVRGQRAEERKLIACYVARPGVKVTEAGLREQMRGRLPDYMVPAALRPVDQLPLTVNGKVDRRALLEEVEAVGIPSPGLVWPADAMEAAVLQVWQQELERRDFGVTDDFFALGGHSLMALRTISAVETALQRRIPLPWLMEHPTVRALVAAVRQADAHPEVRLMESDESARTPVPISGSGVGADSSADQGAPARVVGESPATPTEAKLVGLWCRLLERETVGVTDDFFAVGGHSLLAVRMIQMVHHELGVLLPFPLLLDLPRIRDIARAVDERCGREAGPVSAVGGPAVAETRTPCFLLGWLIRTEGLLPPEQPLYVLPFPEIAAEADQCRVESIAADCLRVLRSVRPHGPYLLAGYSAAGVVAFEIASQLRRAGETVSLLALIDCAAPPRLRRGLFQTVDRLGSKLGWSFRRKLQLARWVGLAYVHYLHGLGLGFFRHFASELANVPTIWRRRRRARRQPSVAGSPAPAASELPSERYWRLTWASALYDPPVYDGAITVLATQVTADVYYRHGGDWRRIAREVREIRIPGSHYSCVTDHRSSLASHLAACCQEAQPGENTAAADSSTDPHRA